MKIDKTRCDRCGFEQPNPTTFIAPALVKMRRQSEQLFAVDVVNDMCMKCYDEVQAAITAALKL